MDKVKVIEIKRSVYESNDREADALRTLSENGTALLESGLFRQAKEMFEYI